MRQRTVSVIRHIGQRLVAQRPQLMNPSHAPLGMLDVERITSVAAPITTITTRPLETALQTPLKV
jgi:hypothetical protein